jgi:alkyl hydroperoxide reductase 1
LILDIEWANKKVVLFAVPGAFTPGCSARHLPGYIENLSKFKTKGVDVIAVIAFNDAWVMSAWGKANGIKGDDIVRSAIAPPPTLLSPLLRI